MGFTDLTLNGSDMAADMASFATSAMVRVLRKELSNKANEYNTPGPVNVALFFEERLIPGGFGQDFHSDLTKLAEETLELLEQHYIACDGAEWDDATHKNEHMGAYKRMINSMKKFIKDSEFN